MSPNNQPREEISSECVIKNTSQTPHREHKTSSFELFFSAE